MGVDHILMYEPVGLAHARGLPHHRRRVAPVQPRARGRQRRLLPPLRSLPRRGAGALGAALARHVAALAVVPVLAVAAVLAGAAFAPQPAEAGSRGVDYLRAAQNRDGGFGGTKGEASTPLYAAWAGIGIAAAGERCGGPLTAYLRRTGATGRGGVGGRRADDPRAAGVRERDHGRRPRPARGPAAGPARRRLLERPRQRDGVRRPRPRAAGVPRSSASLLKALRWVTARQHADGGFSFPGRTGRSDIDVTSGVVQALASVRGRDAGTVGRRAVAFLRGQQRPDGGFPLTAGGASNAQSTAFAVQALVAAGVRPGAVRRNGSRTATGYIGSLTTADGSVRYSRTSAQTPVWVTAQVLPALSARPLPVTPG